VSEKERVGEGGSKLERWEGGRDNIVIAESAVSAEELQFFMHKLISRCETLLRIRISSWNFDNIFFLSHNINLFIILKFYNISFNSTAKSYEIFLCILIKIIYFS
jgi:hypothetical protein